MTEGEWLAGTDPERLFEFVGPRLNERQKRLFAVACCRRVWPCLPDERSRRAIEVTEAYADGKARAEDMWSACEDANEADDEVERRFHHAPYAATDASADELRLHTVTLFCALAAGHHALRDKYEDAVYEEADRAEDDHPYNVELEAVALAETAAQADLLRDIAGNPFRPVAFTPAWRTERVRQLARTIHEQRAFDRMPELAAVLAETGCGGPTILEHCRGPGPHTRGCWVLDWLLEPTQEEWEAIQREESMWGQVERLWLWGKMDARKLRLFGVACVDGSGCDLPEVAFQALAVAERHADGQATREELAQAREEVGDWLEENTSGPQRHPVQVVACVVGRIPLDAGTVPLQLGWKASQGMDWSAVTAAGERALLAEMVGEPFRPVVLDPAWLTPQVRALAEVAYEERGLEGLGILADALEEAGCTEARVLEHCRGEGEHVRGCWVLDLLLGRGPPLSPARLAP